jgi:hypothetical protein
VLGQTLVAQGALSATELVVALAEQRRRAEAGKPMRLGELLIDMHLIRPEQLARALAQRETTPA